MFTNIFVKQIAKSFMLEKDLAIGLQLKLVEISSEEWKQKVSKANSGKVRSQKTKDLLSKIKSKVVVCVETNVEYKNAYIAEIETGITRSNISSVCRGVRKTAGGYSWRFK